MTVIKSLRNLWATGYVFQQTKTLVPQAMGLIEDSAMKLINKANYQLFGPTAEEIVKDIDLKDKYCLITGANSGIGLEMTRCLNARDCHVLMACRNGYAARLASRVCDNLDLLSVIEVNLASLKSVKNFTDRVVSQDKKFNIVILNAAVFGLPWTLTEDGLETIFQVNYLAQIYLLMNIEKLLAHDARVVFITSESHRYVNWSLENRLHPTEEIFSLPEAKYTSIKAFNISKLCNIFAMQYLGHRWMKTNRSVFAASPGSFVKTKLCSNWWAHELLYSVMQPFNKSMKQAAATPLYCATAPELEGSTSLYFKDCKRTDQSQLAMDAQLPFRILDITENMIKDCVSGFQIDPPKATTPESVETANDQVNTCKEPETRMSSCSG